MGQLDRITQEPAVMGGKACIRGLRVTVGMIGAGQSVDELLSDYLISSGKISCRHCATQPGALMSARSR